MIVVDASVAVKWLRWEADSLDALEFLRKHDLAAPELIFLEVASALVNHVNQKPATGPDALRALEKWTIAWSDHVVKNYRVTQRRLFAASNIALRIGHKLADCVYLALAQELGCELATADAKFVRKAAPLYSRIKLLHEYAEGGDREV